MTKTSLTPLKMLLFFFHATNTIVLSFLPLFLQYKQLTGKEIGLVLAIGPLATIISQPFWGFLSDKYKTVKKMLIISVIGMLLFSIVFFNMEHLVTLLIFGALFYFFSSPVGALSDSLAQRQADNLNVSFGSIRTWGSIGFAFSSLMIGEFLNIFGIQFIVWPYISFGLILLIIVFKTADVKSDSAPARFSDVKLLMTNKPFITFLILMMFITITHRVNDSFIGLYIAELGGSERFVGVSWFVSLISEATVFALAFIWFKRKNALNFIVLASFVYVVRWLLFSFVDNPIHIIGLQVLHGFTFAIFYLAALYFVTRLIPKMLKATGHLFFYSVFFGVSGIIGSLGGGIIIDLFNGEILYFMNGIVALIGAVSLFIYRKKITIKSS